jgi:hypothetical protein
MRPTRAHTHGRFRRGEPELGVMGLGDTWGQHGRDPTHCQLGSAPCGLALGSVLRGQHPDRQWGVDKTLEGDDDCITEIPSVTVADTTCGDLQTSPSLRSPSRQAMNVPYDTMVSFTRNFEHVPKRPILTCAGKKSAHIYMAVLLLRERFDSVQRRWMP